MSRPQSDYLLATVVRAVRVLDALKEAGELTFTELVDTLGIDKSTVYRFLVTLKHLRLVDQDPKTSKYRLGIGILEYANRVLSNLELRSIALPYLEDLRRLSGESANLSILDQGDRVLWIEILPSPQALRVNSGVGLRVLPHCTAAGKAILAHLPETEVERIATETGLPRLTANTITEIDQLKQELERIRSRGFAIDNQEHWQELNCVGAPIFGSDGRCIGAISTSGPAFRFSLEKVTDLGSSVKMLAAEISRNLGNVGPAGIQSSMTTD